tara:strand:+ start:90 stop:866 length:777 start_codon:yes stop_codon:yes gene_type:complete
MKKIIILLFFLPNLVFGQTESWWHEPSSDYGIDLHNYEKYMPTSSCGEILNYSYFSVSFCEEYKLSEWTIHYLTPDRLTYSSSRKGIEFRKDPRLNGRDNSKLDFYKSGYDRGHMVPAADMAFDKTRLTETFFLTNITPQTAGFNRGGWKVLEERIRDWVVEFDTVAIITGFVKGDNPDNLLGYAGSVPVPKYFYKIFIDIQRKRSIAFLMPNEKITKDIIEYVVPIDYLEKITGLDFFYKLPDDVELSFEINTGNKK